MAYLSRDGEFGGVGRVCRGAIEWRKAREGLVRRDAGGCGGYGGVQRGVVEWREARENVVDDERREVGHRAMLYARVYRGEKEESVRKAMTMDGMITDALFGGVYIVNEKLTSPNSPTNAASYTSQRAWAHHTHNPWPNRNGKYSNNANAAQWQSLPLLALAVHLSMSPTDAVPSPCLLTSHGLINVRRSAQWVCDSSQSRPSSAWFITALATALILFTPELIPPNLLQRQFRSTNELNPFDFCPQTAYRNADVEINEGPSAANPLSSISLSLEPTNADIVEYRSCMVVLGSNSIYLAFYSLLDLIGVIIVELNTNDSPDAGTMEHFQPLPSHPPNSSQLVDEHYTLEEKIKSQMALSQHTSISHVQYRLQPLPELELLEDEAEKRELEADMITEEVFDAELEDIGEKGSRGTSLLNPRNPYNIAPLVNPAGA
ncbi:hypothetical protein F5887DRAFT_921656 [Amanita rubescens]|nr:hypothetical protein F5887DRAFT_921656 [Amanita rubescens]